MSTKTTTTATRPTKKPVPTPIKPQATTNKKPIPRAVQQPKTSYTTGAKKPAPAPVKPQNKPAVAPGSTAAAKKKPAPPKTAGSYKDTSSSYQDKSSSYSNTAGNKTSGNATAQALKAASTPQAKAQQTAEQGQKSDNWISRMVQGQVQRVGDYAGGFVNGIGASVNKVGENVGGR